MSVFLSIYRTSVGRKFVMSCTGLLLGLFLALHLVGNAFMFWGREAFNLYADRLHSLGVLLWLVDAGLVLVFGLHIVTSAVLFLGNRRARPRGYLARPPLPPSNWAARTMPWTGAAILVFLVVHLANFSFAGPAADEALLVRSVLARPGWALYYLFSLLALGFHVSHGFWSLFQSVGISHPKYDAILRRAVPGVAAAAAGVFGLIPLLFLVDRNFLV